MFFHLVATNSADYFERRDRPFPRELQNAEYGATHRLAHINRWLATRDICRTAGPSIDGAIADTFLCTPDRKALDEFLRTDPYVVGGVWEKVDIAPFVQITEFGATVEACLDGSRRVTAIEGTLTSNPTVTAALEKMRSDGKLVVGGVREGDRFIAWVRPPEATEAVRLLGTYGIEPDGLKTRTMVWVL